MSDLEEKTAQETINTEINADVSNGVKENADLNKQNEELINDFDFTDTDNQNASEETAKYTDKPKQSREQNSENARRRREEERQKELKSVREKAIIDTLGGKNPYTDEPMIDSIDVEEYLTMKEIEKNGGDPLADFSKFSKQKTKKEIENKAEKEKQEQWFINDREQFFKKYPDVNVDQLFNDVSFKKFATGKIGVQPMSQIYEDYTDLIVEYEKKSKQYAQKIIANANATPGSLSTNNGSHNDGFYTREEVAKMTQQEVHQNYEKIRESMRKW